MGKGGDNMVASAHSLAIGVGEVIGPVLGGMMVELLPQSPVRVIRACTLEVDVPSVDFVSFLARVMLNLSSVFAVCCFQGYGFCDRDEVALPCVQE